MHDMFPRLTSTWVSRRSVISIGACILAANFGCARDPVVHSPVERASSISRDHHHHGHSHDHAHLHAHSDSTGHAHCVCDEIRLTNGWCAACQVGYVASIKMTSAVLFDVLDAHGHDHLAKTVECTSCQAAIANQGFCRKCELGFYGGQLYCSHLSYCFAHGENRNPANITCATCRTNAHSEPGWCDRCEIGMVGNIAFRDKTFFEESAREFATLLAAVEKEKNCEFCAAVMFAGGECPNCKPSTTYTAPTH